jgi:hypothetical protein
LLLVESMIARSMVTNWVPLVAAHNRISGLVGENFRWWRWATKRWQVRHRKEDTQKEFYKFIISAVQLVKQHCNHREDSYRRIEREEQKASDVTLVYDLWKLCRFIYQYDRVFPDSGQNSLESVLDVGRRVVCSVEVTFLACFMAVFVE